MKKFYTPEKNCFCADHIEVLTVARDQGFEIHHKDGRYKHSFIYLQSGSLLCRFFDAAPMEVTADELIFIPEKTAHTTRYQQNGTQVKIVQFELAVGSLPHYLTAPVKLPLHHAGELIDGFFESARPHPMRCLSLLYELLYRIDCDRTREPIKFKKLQPILEELHAHPEQDRRIAAYAERCEMSEAGFRRLFREYTGTSPVDYRNALRLERARLLLSNGGYNVSEASSAVGFSNLSFFIRLYKRKYGHTPTNS